ncbi:hypothetical protein Tco_1347348, partial [Tanacetum coccineum]
MSRANPQAAIVSEEQLVLSANRLMIKKNNHCVASDSNITGTLLRLVVGILNTTSYTNQFPQLPLYLSYTYT